MPDLSLYSPDQIKLTGGVSGAIMSNAVGIPLDRFRILVAQDLKNLSPVTSHFRNTFNDIPSAFTGAFARVSMKIGATALNLYVPPEFRESNPFGCAFAVGFGFAPILNIPRVLQLGKIQGNSYPESIRTFFTSGSGLLKYGTNTGMWAPGEGLRMMMCFGTKDYLMPKCGGTADPREVTIPLFCLRLSGIVAPLVSVVETTFAVTTETITTVHAKTVSDPQFKGKPFGDVVKETVTPKYTGRCFSSLLFKNILTNAPLFWIMFMADFYTKKGKLNRGEIKM